MIHAVETGRADGPPLVLAHGLATDLHLWDDVVPYLAPHFRIIRYDARGHGKTPPPAAPSWTMEALVADALSVMDRFALNRAAFAGLSMGGMTGLGLALDHPERVSKLVVMNARADAPEPYAKAWDQRIATLHEHGLAALAKPTLARWFTADFTADAAAMARMHAMVLRTSPAGFEGCGRALQGLDYRRRLPGMTVPTLYLIGDEDQGAPAHVMQDMADATPGSRSETITHSGHLSAVEQPRHVAEALLRFLA